MNPDILDIVLGIIVSMTPVIAVVVGFYRMVSHSEYEG